MQNPPRQIRANCGAAPPAANPVLCAEHIAFPLGKVARCGAARTATDEGRPPAAGVTARSAACGESVYGAGAPSAPLCKGSCRAFGATEGL